MKRTVALILLLLALFSFVGCPKKSNTSTVNFYYCTANPEHHNQASVIHPEQRKIETNLSDLEEILGMYFEGPVSSRLNSPFPSGTKLITVQPSKEVVAIVLSDEIGTLNGVELMIACACLATTVLEISQSEVVEIRAENALLNNQEYIEFTSQSVLSFS